MSVNICFSLEIASDWKQECYLCKKVIQPLDKILAYVGWQSRYNVFSQTAVHFNCLEDYIQTAERPYDKITCAICGQSNGKVLRFPMYYTTGFHSECLKRVIDYKPPIKPTGYTFYQLYKGAYYETIESIFTKEQYKRFHAIMQWAHLPSRIEQCTSIRRGRSLKIIDDELLIPLKQYNLLSAFRSKTTIGSVIVDAIADYIRTKCKPLKRICPDSHYEDYCDQIGEQIRLLCERTSKEKLYKLISGKVLTEALFSNKSDLRVHAAICSKELGVKL